MSSVLSKLWGLIEKVGGVVVLASITREWTEGFKAWHGIFLKVLDLYQESVRQPITDYVVRVFAEQIAWISQFKETVCVAFREPLGYVYDDGVLKEKVYEKTEGLTWCLSNLPYVTTDFLILGVLVLSIRFKVNLYLHLLELLKWLRLTKKEKVEQIRGFWQEGKATYAEVVAELVEGLRKMRLELWTGRSIVYRSIGFGLLLASPILLVFFAFTYIWGGLFFLALFVAVLILVWPFTLLIAGFNVAFKGENAVDPKRLMRQKAMLEYVGILILLFVIMIGINNYSAETEEQLGIETPSEIVE